MKNYKCRWGIIGLGSIATTFATDLKQSKYGILQAAASRSFETAQKFTHKFGGTASESYEALIARDDIDAIYIATPNTSHYELASKCISASKPVLCEKPLAVNYGQALTLFGQASRNNTLLVEGLMYLMHPRMQLARDLIKQGKIGEPTRLTASFGFEFPYKPDNALHRLYNRDLAGGSILDIGIYPLTAARYFFGEPQAMKINFAVLSPGKVDMATSVDLQYEKYSARLHCSFQEDLPLRIRIEGTKSALILSDAWHPRPNKQAISIVTRKPSLDVHMSDERRPLYAVEADHFAELLMAKELESDVLPADFSLNTAFWMDRWRDEAGVEYTEDKLATSNLTVAKYSQEKTQELLMQSSFYPPLQRDLSALVLGTDNQVDEVSLGAMADAYIQAGGNVFDTAYVYSNGLGETLLGKWMKTRGYQKNRSDIVIIGKGAHPPECKPQSIQKQLDTTLQRLQTDYLDIYLLHRDDPSIPVGEWMEALNTEYESGRIKQFGGSNWTSERIDQANEYAVKHGLQQMTAVSNNFSLARMKNPVWPGCIASSEDTMRQWHQEQKMPLFAWSSQARGFFLDWDQKGLAASKHGADPTYNELMRVWASEDNTERRRRAYLLSRELKVKPIQIALAYVFAQSFPIFALVGPRNISQLDESVRGSKLQLSKNQALWLDLQM